jgi:hypothetical protein
MLDELAPSTCTRISARPRHMTRPAHLRLVGTACAFALAAAGAGCVVPSPTPADVSADADRADSELADTADVDAPDVGAPDSQSDADAQPDSAAAPDLVDVSGATDAASDVPADIDVDAPAPLIDPAAALPPLPVERSCALGDPFAPEPMVPPTLRETGCFVGDEVLTPAPELVPYEVNSPLWTDGAFKQRFFATPAGSVVGIAGDAPWDFPVGSVIVKNFGFELADASGHLAPRIVETRFLVHRARG